MILSKYIQQLTSLNQGHNKNLGKAPHKPVLLLAVIKAIENNIITSNKICITPELVSYFRSYWEKLVSTGHTSNFALPFYHLKNEKSDIWTLKNKPGYEFAITSSNSIRSFKALTEALEYAQLDNELFEILKIEENRNIIKAAIINKYFPNVEKALINKEYDYLKVLEEQILNDSPAIYSKRIQGIIENEEADEEFFVRKGAFKKQISMLYENTCAITGMKVDTIVNVSLIDACHIVPFAESHDDTITNGIALCPNMHRAFDGGLISIDENYKVMISDKFIENYTSYSIHQFEKKVIRLPKIEKYFPSQENLEMHRVRFGFR